MKPPRFTYHDVDNVSDAVDLLSDLGDEAKFLAGGQSLVPLMNMRFAMPSHLVDINRCKELDYIQDEGDVVAVGALARHRTVENSSDVSRACPLLQQALKYVGHTPIRTRGTIGGSLAHADPAAEIATVLACLSGSVTTRSASGKRVLGFDELVVGPFSTVLEPDELITEVRFPTLGPSDGWSFIEFSRRRGDFAIATVAAVLRITDGRVSDAAVGIGGAASKPFKARKAGDLVKGESLTPRLIEQVAQIAARECEPAADQYGSTEYRRNLVKVLVGKALTEAHERNASRQAPS
jgi:CO/xanthine dehydrogenase FAD-binding subunit